MSISSTITTPEQPLELSGATGSIASELAREAAENNGTLSQLTGAASFSLVAPRLQEALSQISSPENNVIETLSNNVNRLQDGFVNALYSVLAEAAVDLSCKITLRMDKTGQLIVLGDHPQKERIEAVFADNPELSGAFLEISSQSAALRDIRSLHTMVMNIAGIDHYARLQAPPADIAYQVSIKGEMSHFYFNNPRYLA